MPSRLLPSPHVQSRHPGRARLSECGGSTTSGAEATRNSDPARRAASATTSRPTIGRSRVSMITWRRPRPGEGAALPERRLGGEPVDKSSAVEAPRPGRGQAAAGSRGSATLDLPHSGRRGSRRICRTGGSSSTRSRSLGTPRRTGRSSTIGRRTRSPSTTRSAASPGGRPIRYPWVAACRHDAGVQAAAFVKR